jgi:hypothetical protein
MAEIRVDGRWTRSPKAGRTMFGGPHVRRFATLSAVAAHEIVVRYADYDVVIRRSSELNR